MRDHGIEVSLARAGGILKHGSRPLTQSAVAVLSVPGVRTFLCLTWEVSGQALILTSDFCHTVGGTGKSRNLAQRQMV